MTTFLTRLDPFAHLVTVGVLLSGSLPFFVSLHFTQWKDLMTVLREGAKELDRSSKSRPEGWSQSRKHTRCVLLHQTQLFLFTLLFVAFSHSLWHIILSITPCFLSLFWSSLLSSQVQQAGNTSESCDRGAKNTAGVVLPILAVSHDAWICSSWNENSL